MTISPISYTNYHNSYSIRQNNCLKNKPQVPENTTVSFNGLEKVVTKTTETQGKKIVTPILATAATLMAAVGTYLNNFIETQKEKKEFDKIFKLHTEPGRTYNYKIYSPAIATINDHFVKFEPMPWRAEYATKYLENGKTFKEWAFKTIKEYKKSGLSIENYAKTHDCYWNVEKLLKAYEKPRTFTAYELLPKDVKKMIDKNIKIEVGETTFVDSTYHERLHDDLYSVDGNINGVKFKLVTNSYAYWPQDKDMFAKWAKKHISKYEKTGTLPYRYAELHGEDKIGVKLLLWAYEDAKENGAKEYFKENIATNKGISREQIDAYLETLPKEKRALALQDLFINGKISQGFVEYEEKIAKEKAEEDTKQAIAFAETKQKAQDKFGIEITEVIADSHPSKGDCDVISYTFEGEEQKCYLPAPPGGRTETEVLEAFMKKYNSVDDFRSVPIIDYSTKTINL